MIVSLIKTYIVLVNVARCCRNLVWLLYAKIPVLIVNHCPSSYIRRIVSNLVSIYMSKTADWQSKARVLINLSIRERFRIFIMNPGRASSIFNVAISCILLARQMFLPSCFQVICQQSYRDYWVKILL